MTKYANNDVHFDSLEVAGRFMLHDMSDVVNIPSSYQVYPECEAYIDFTSRDGWEVFLSPLIP